MTLSQRPNNRLYINSAYIVNATTIHILDVQECTLQEPVAFDDEDLPQVDITIEKDLVDMAVYLPQRQSRPPW